MDRIPFYRNSSHRCHHCSPCRCRNAKHSVCIDPIPCNGTHLVCKWLIQCGCSDSLIRPTHRDSPRRRLYCMRKTTTKSI